jgi:RNA polymerase sigma factor (sigma-70 family)
VDQFDVAQHLQLAQGGDHAAWNRVVARFTPLLWAIARAHRLSDSDSADAVQGTWLRLVENLGRIREPERLPAWLATTCRRECLTALRKGGRERPVEQQAVIDLSDRPGAAVEGRLLQTERDRLLWTAFEGLSDQCRALLRVLMADPAPSYEEVGAALEMPIGSIGPTRARCLRRLQGLVTDAGLSREDLGTAVRDDSTPAAARRGAER